MAAKEPDRGAGSSLTGSLIAALVGQHRVIEAGLDQLAGAIANGTSQPDLFRQIAAWIAQHYVREEAFLRRLQAHDARLAAKLRAQHDEALEIAARLEESFAAGESGDVPYLARRFLAITQHNMIEEERDVFPLAERILSGQE